MYLITVVRKRVLLMCRLPGNKHKAFSHVTDNNDLS
jgi:hypothetical protein